MPILELSMITGAIVEMGVQAGYESGMSVLLGTLAGINMISGAGMLDFLRAQSLEKLVVDAEFIAMAGRLLRGIETPDESLGAALIRAVGHHGEFLSQKHTRYMVRPGAADPIRRG